jgi:hypothetical protein
MEPRELATTYFEAWKARDFDTLRTILAHDCTFRGPLGAADSGQACVEGLRAMSRILEDVDVQRVFVDGGDVLTWFDLHTSVAPPAPTANWMHTEGGKIARIRVTFDARELAPPA